MMSVDIFKNGVENAVPWRIICIAHRLKECTQHYDVERAFLRIYLD